jgi:creatinine amidohydrolase
MRRVKYEEMTAEEIVAAMNERSLVYVPIGSLEYHGCHLPVGLDTMHAHRVCLAVAERTGGVVLPPTYWGTRGHEGWDGSVLLEEETVAALVRNILEALAGMGYKLIVVCTGHYPEVQGRLLEKVAAEYMSGEGAARVVVLDPFAFQPMEPVLDHGGRVETSIMLGLRPDLVDMARLKTHPDAFRGVAETCVEATAEEGEERFEGAVKGLVRRVEEELGKGKAEEPNGDPSLRSG